jgi:hypothetical protein
MVAIIGQTRYFGVTQTSHKEDTITFIACIVSHRGEGFCPGDDEKKKEGKKVRKGGREEGKGGRKVGG